jgi:hypothetical protein
MAGKAQIQGKGLLDIFDERINNFGRPIQKRWEGFEAYRQTLQAQIHQINEKLKNAKTGQTFYCTPVEEDSFSLRASFSIGCERKDPHSSKSEKRCLVYIEMDDKNGDIYHREPEAPGQNRKRASKVGALENIEKDSQINKSLSALIFDEIPERERFFVYKKNTATTAAHIPANMPANLPS